MEAERNEMSAQVALDELEQLAEAIQEQLYVGNPTIESCAEATQSCMALLDGLLSADPGLLEDEVVKELRQRLETISRFKRASAADPEVDDRIYMRYCSLQTLDIIHKLSDHLS